jgi:uncharacterized protein
VFETEKYTSLYNFYNGGLITVYDDAERNSLREILSGDPVVNSDKMLNALLRGDFLVKPDDDIRDRLNLIYNQACFNANQLGIIMILSETCNFRCEYCYEEYDAKVMSDDISQGVISFIKDRIQFHGYKEVSISWFGGEPTLYKDRIVSFMRTLHTELSGVAVSGAMTTNAYLLSGDDFLDYYSVGINNYQITVDGFEQTHNKLRALKGGGDTWRTINDNLKAIYEYDFTDLSVLLRINYNEEVLQDIYSFMNYIKEQFGNRFTIHTHPISNLGGGKDFFSDDGLVAMAENSIGEFIATNGIKSDYANLRTKRFGGVCYASAPNSFLIDAEGIVRKCTVHLHSDDNKVGQIKDSNEFSLDSNALLKWTETELSNDDCNECCIYPVCMKRGCTSAVLSGNNECRYNKDAIFNYLSKIIENAYNRALSKKDVANDSNVELKNEA